MATEATDPMAVVQAFNDASNSGEIERILAFFTDDAVIRTVPPPPPPAPEVSTGKQQIREWFEPQMPNLHVVSSNLKTSADTVTWDATVSGDMFRQIGDRLIRCYGGSCGEGWEDYVLYRDADP